MTKDVPPGALVVGVPARVVRPLAPNAPDGHRRTTADPPRLIRHAYTGTPARATRTADMSTQPCRFSRQRQPAAGRGDLRCLEMPLGKALVERYRNGETRVLLEESVRGADVFVIQPTCTPVNEHLMELLIMLDALRRVSAARITAVIPYYGYAKQEKKTAPREPISAKLVANLLVEAGRRPHPDLRPARPGHRGLLRHPGRSPAGAPPAGRRICAICDLPNPVIVAPDAGRVGWALEFREIDRRRPGVHRQAPSRAWTTPK